MSACRQQDEAGYWVCIVLAGFWPEMLEVIVYEKQFKDGTWYEETEHRCCVCGEIEHLY